MDVDVEFQGLWAIEEGYYWLLMIASLDESCELATRGIFSRAGWDR